VGEVNGMSIKWGKHILISYRLKLLNIFEAENFIERHSFNGPQIVSVP